MVTNSLGLAMVAGLAVGLLPAAAQAQAVPGGTLDPTTIPKYVTPMVIPPVLFDDGGAPMTVDVSLSQFTQQVLPAIGCIAASAAQVAAGGPAIACNGDAFPATTLWGYGDPARGGSVAEGGTFNNPSFTIEVTKDTMTEVKWINDLLDGNVNALPHIIQDQNGTPIIDQTLHWAAPNSECLSGEVRTDCRGASAGPYFGPVPMVVHVHGAHVGPGSDGYPEAWWLPNAGNVDCTNVDGYPATPDPADDFDCNGTFFESANGDDTDNALGQGYAIDMYPNDQPTTTLWYHDHSLGITRLNVYATSAGFWLIRDAADGETGLLSGVLPGPAPKVSDAILDLNTPGNPVRNAIREIPIAIQPKSFNADGSQFYPAARAFFEGLGDGQTFGGDGGNAGLVNIPYLPQGTSDIAPSWNPEAFFNTMVVNGSTWPVLEVAPERYRFRLLNASDSRFMNLSLYLVNGQGTKLRELPFYQIGTEQGLLPQAVRIETGYATPLPGTGTAVNSMRLDCLLPNGRLQNNCVPAVSGTFAQQALLMGPAERPDVVVDFSGLEDGDMVVMYNTGPDAPFGGFPDIPADPGTSGQVMAFRVSSALANPTGDPSTPAPWLLLDANPGGVPKLGAPDAVQDLALLEEESALICVTFDAVTGVIDQVVGSVPPDCALGGEPFAPKAAVLGTNGSGGGTVQLWSDPIQQNPALNDVEQWEMWNWSADAHPIHLHLVKFEVVNREVIGGAVRPPEPWEAGWKDTVIAYPGEITRVKALFDVPGLYVWHCHILSHEDNEMMVPYCVGEPGVDCPEELF
jgi:FtsP/CotA-like multicopper oxidase with cupredoxin domain